MSLTGLDVFDATLNTTHVWLNDLMQELGTDDRHQAYVALRAVLHALRDRLTVDEAAQLGAQLPMLIRGFYYEGWDPSDKPLKERRKGLFLAHVRDVLSRSGGAGRLDPLQATRAVFAVLARRVSAGEIEDVKGMLPAEVRALWP